MNIRRTLKRKLIYLILVIGKFGLCYSQDNSSNYIKPKFEIFVGASYLSPEIDSAYFAVDLVNKIVPQLGLGVIIPINNFTLNVRLQQEIKGFKGSYNITYDHDEPPGYITGREKFNVNNYYTSIALYSTYFIGKNRKFGIGFGGYGSYLNKSKISVNHIPGDPIPDQLKFQTEKFEKYDFGILFNAQFKMPLNESSDLLLSVQKDIGLQNTLGKDITNDHPLTYFNSSVIKNYGTSINLALRFSLQKPETKSDLKKHSFKTHKLTSFIESVSLLGGPSIGFLRGNENVETTSQNKRKVLTSYSFGIGLNHKIDKKYSIDFLLIHETKGGASSTKTTFFDPDTETFYYKWVYREYDFKYWTVPIILNYRPMDLNGLQLGVGAFASYRTEQSRQFQTYLKDFDFGIVSKIGYVISISDFINFELQILNTNGLKNLLPNAVREQTLKTNNTSLLFTLTKKLKPE